jgi:hypothetical protein
MIRPKIIKNIAEEIPQVNDLADAYEACCARNETVKNELTRMLSHLAPDVEPANDIVSVFWQVDNAVYSLLKLRPTQLAPDACPYCLGSGKGKMNDVEVGCMFCAKTGKRG